MHYSSTGRHQYETSLDRAKREVLKAYSEAGAANDEGACNDLAAVLGCLIELWEASQLQHRPDRRGDHMKLMAVRSVDSTGSVGCTTSESGADQ